MLDFASPPPLGTILMLDDQAYELREVRPHQCKDGSTTTLLDWKTACPECSAPFIASTALKSSGPNRRCVGCRNGRIVKGKRGRRVQAQVLAP